VVIISLGTLWFKIQVTEPRHNLGEVLPAPMFSVNFINQLVELVPLFLALMVHKEPQSPGQLRALFLIHGA
jgi:hypothetical protein